MAAVLGVDLREAEHLAVGQLAAQLAAHLVQVGDLLSAQRQAFLLVVGLQVVDVDDRIRLLADGEYHLVQPVIDALQHRVVIRLGRADGEVFLDAGDALQAHVLGDLDRVRAPRGNHLAARADEMSFHGLSTCRCRAAEEPHQLFRIFW